MEAKIILKVFFATLALLYFGMAKAQGTIFFATDVDGQPTISPGKIHALDKPVRAILAMYTFQAGTGCLVRDSNVCALTTALGIKEQCSKEHFTLVGSWFSHSMPDLTPNIDNTLKRPFLDATSEFVSCYFAPDTASDQRVWRKIDVAVHGDRIKVSAMLSYLWMRSDPPRKGGLNFETEYQIVKNAAIVVSHKESDIINIQDE